MRERRAVVKCAAFMVAVVVVLGRPREDLDDRDALNQGGPAKQLRIRRVNSSHLRKPKPRDPLKLSQTRRKFDGRVDNDDVVASDREARWNGEGRVGACWCNGLFGARQARLASRRHKLGGSDESRIRGRSGLGRARCFGCRRSERCLLRG